MSIGTSSRGSSALDGNAAAGILSVVFAGDATCARATCVSCGATEHVGALRLYAYEMGAVLRCPGCDAVVLRLGRTRTELWLDAPRWSAIVRGFTTRPT